MKRISTATAVQNRFVDGNKSTGRMATQFSAEWCNQIQEEIAGLLESNGVTLGASENQLVALFSKVFASGFDSIHMSKDGSTMDADGEGVSIRKSRQYVGIVETLLKATGLTVSAESVGHATYGSNAITLYDINGNIIGQLAVEAHLGETVFNANIPYRSTSSIYGDNWRVRKGALGVFSLERNGGTASSPNWIKVVEFNSSGACAISEFVREKNVVLASSDVNLTSSPYSDVAAGTKIVVVNDKDDDNNVVVNYGTSGQENVGPGTAKAFFKNSHGVWCRLDGELLQ